MKTTIIYPVRALLLSSLLLWLAGCSSTPTPTEAETPPLHTIESMENMDVKFVTDGVYDPWEPMNRKVYNFNYHFDHYVFLPVVNAYEFVLPNFAQDGISNFFSNLGEISNFANSLLQLKPAPTATALGRFVINTTVGIVGLWDPATKMGLEEQEEDFGQTLGHYGVGDGPYLVLPFLGPSNLRDTTGLVADTVIFNEIDMLNFDGHHDDRELAYILMDAIDTRHTTSFRYYETGSAFEYDFIRLLYGKARQLEISR